MKIEIDTTNNTLHIQEEDTLRKLALYSEEAFEYISTLWLKIGWNEKYPYTFSWLGRPLIQLPEDVMRVQEVIYQLKPDVIVETGVAHGGSLIFYASLCKAIGKGRVIGVDIEIRAHNRSAIEAHELSSYVTLIEGNSIDEKIIQQVKGLINETDKVLVILDSNHTKQHVLKELEAYSHLVTPGSYVIVTDGSMEFLYDVPRASKDWQQDNPKAAAKEFLEKHPEFLLSTPKWIFNESQLTQNVTHWPHAWIQKKVNTNDP